MKILIKQEAKPSYVQVSASAYNTAPAHCTSSLEDKEVCYKLKDLTPFCPDCPPPCPNFNNCGCTFTDGTVIQPKELDYYPRPPYCEDCLGIVCLVVIECDDTQPCTAAHIQGLINK